MLEIPAFVGLLLLTASGLTSNGRLYHAQSEPKAAGLGICEVYQYALADSTNKKLVLIRTYNAAGQVVENRYTDYRESPDYGKERGTERFSYRDTALVEHVFIDEQGDQTKTLYLRDAANRLTQEERLTYERRLKKSVDKGNGRPGGCIVVGSDYHKRRTWKKTSVIRYTYDAQGRRVSYDAPELHYTSQNRYTWAYDSQGRVSKHTSYDNQRLIWVADYTYFPGGYRRTRTWYEADGSLAHLKPKNQGYWPLYTVHFYCDSSGLVHREETTNEKGELRDRRLLYYNARGQLVKDVCQDGEGKTQLTHLYVYK